MRRTAKAEAIARLQAVIQRIDSIKEEVLGSPAYVKWHRDTEVAILHIFGGKTRHISDFRAINYYAISRRNPVTGHLRAPTHQESKHALACGLAKAKAILESMVDEIQDYWIDEVDAEPPATPLESSKSTVLSGCVSIAKKAVQLARSGMMRSYKLILLIAAIATIIALFVSPREVQSFVSTLFNR